MDIDKDLTVAEPILILGDTDTVGMRLPGASATPSTLYGPRGVFYDGYTLVVADTGNHRVLLWFGLTDRDGAPADLVLGQENFYGDSPNASKGAETGMYMPCGVLIHEGKLFVADSWNHRVLVWDGIPSSNNQPPDHVIGQQSLRDNEAHTGESISPFGFFWCFGIGFVGEYFFVCDTGNRRVLGWKGIPAYGDTPDILLGQDDFHSYDENRGGQVGINTFLWPHSISSNGEMTYIADAGNHRVIGFRGVPSDSAKPKVLLGQENFSSAVENPYVPQSAHTLRFPYGVSVSDKTIAVADTSNNRVLMWEPVPEEGIYIPARFVVGQEDFSSYGENRWQSVERDTLCWCYDVHIYKNLLFVADTGNNRVSVWRLLNP